MLRPLSASDERYSRSRARPSAVMRSAALRAGSGRPAVCACSSTPPSSRRTVRRLLIDLSFGDSSFGVLGRTAAGTHDVFLPHFVDVELRRVLLHPAEHVVEIELRGRRKADRVDARDRRMAAGTGWSGRASSACRRCASPRRRFRGGARRGASVPSARSAAARRGNRRCGAAAEL